MRGFEMIPQTGAACQIRIGQIRTIDPNDRTTSAKGSRITARIAKKVKSPAAGQRFAIFPRQF
jgi:hypothetical protein